MKKLQHDFDFCVVGGGMAGLIAALSAARHGIKTALIQDRPVLGGNSSSEIRMHVCGARGPHKREGGILEELFLENHYRNPESCYSIWDSVLYGAAIEQKNLTLFLNCSVSNCEVEEIAASQKNSGTPNGLKAHTKKIKSVTGWQLTTETWHTINAKTFADCSGDGILAPLTGAEYRIGREDRTEYNESIAPEIGDKKTMGLSCLFQAREYPTPRKFTPPAWAHLFTKPEDLRGRDTKIVSTNFWWMEVGGDYDSIHDTEVLRNDLLKIAFGVWNYIKNYGPDKEKYANWALDWVGFLPGKRESRRYVGDHVLTQNDIEAGGKFEDIVAYGGWSMDDHFPAGFYYPKAGTIFHPAPSPYGIAYRTLYSANVSNLFCAGRNHSASHAAMSSTRVMGTTSLMGQAVGIAASIAIKNGFTPREVYQNKLNELQETLMQDDCWLPGKKRSVPEITLKAKITAESGDASPLINGEDRPIEIPQTPETYEMNRWQTPLGKSLTFEWDNATSLKEVRIVFDSEFNRSDKGNAVEKHSRNMRYNYPLNTPAIDMPGTMTKEFVLEAMDDKGNWVTCLDIKENHSRLFVRELNVKTKKLKFTPKATWGDSVATLFSFEVK